MVPVPVARTQPLVDVTAAMSDSPAARPISLKVIAPVARADAPDDPFAEVEV
jgi:hypothetical protein